MSKCSTPPYVPYKHSFTHLAQSTGQSKQEDSVQDARVAFSETQEIPYLSGPQHRCEQKTSTEEEKNISVNLKTQHSHWLSDHRVQCVYGAIKWCNTVTTVRRSLSLGD